MSVKVAVRVRPFNKRQIDLGCKLVVDMKDPETILKSHQKQSQRKFTFDYSLWSFDNFKQQSNGYLSPTSPKYADQKQVFDRIGKKILDNAYEGYHCCLFAYGQTGSGKSYSMIGFGQNKGIVPIACNQIFERIKNKKQASDSYEVQASILEIYNETIQDLTIDTSMRPPEGLKIRESKLLGIYVDGVKKHFVESFQQIQKIMQKAFKNRSKAATQMNAQSSRAHTIVTIQLRQKIAATKKQRISLINLIDLAGSERQSKTGATGDRFKEAVSINLSLTTLGQVISTLAEIADGASNKFVPYRNSSLTRILQNALGGNSQTIMICAISPASDNYQQTLSTLRYADQAKKIKNKPVINQSQTDKLIRQLKAENDRLRKLLQQRDKNGPSKSVSDPNKPQQSAQDIAADLNALSKLMDDQLKSKAQKRKQAEQEQEMEKKKQQELNKGQQKILDERQIQKMEKQKKLPPYLQNISRDMMLNRKLKILLQKKHIRIGKKGCTPPNEIIFGGRDMIPHHATLDIDEQGNVCMTPLAKDIHLYLNGQKVQDKVILKHLDRIIFGWNSVYLFKDKQHRRQVESVKSKDIDWDYCKKEVLKFVDIDQSDSEEGGGCCKIF